MTRSVRIAPSILAADFARLGEAVSSVGDVVDMVHVDVMDGHFVPNMSLGPPVIRSLRAATDLYLDCHLMITDPRTYIGPIAEAGADGVTVHIEAAPDPGPAAEAARIAGVDFGLVINPATPVEAIEPFLDRCSMVVVMSVQPGFGGQTFRSDVLPKVERLRESIDSQGLATDIQVDGGIDPVNAGDVFSAGASILVAGTSVFGAPDPADAVRAIRDAVAGADSNEER